MSRGACLSFDITLTGLQSAWRQYLPMTILAWSLVQSERVKYPVNKYIFIGSDGQTKCTVVVYMFVRSNGHSCVQGTYAQVHWIHWTTLMSSGSTSNGSISVYWTFQYVHRTFCRGIGG